MKSMTQKPLGPVPQPDKGELHTVSSNDCVMMLESRKGTCWVKKAKKRGGADGLVAVIALNAFYFLQLTVRHMPKKLKRHKKAFQPAKGRRRSKALKLRISCWPKKQKARYRETRTTGIT
jgi:hypothetical protein